MTTNSGPVLSPSLPPTTEQVLLATQELTLRVTRLEQSIQRLIRLIDGDPETDLPGMRSVLRKHEELYQMYRQLEFTVRVGGSLLGLIGIGNLIGLIVQLFTK